MIRDGATTHGLLSELLLVRMHGRTQAYLEAGERREAVVAACRAEATVPDLPERILARTVYAQAASRFAPVRELLQNALDASPAGARIDVRTRDDGATLEVVDRGRGMSRRELLEDLLVPFRSTKASAPEAIGEHGIGFFSVLEIAPRVELTTSTSTGGSRLVVEPIGAGPRYTDFAWRVSPAEPTTDPATGTTVRLGLARPVVRAGLASEIAAVASMVDPARARIHVDDVLINTARAGLRRAARVPIAGGELGDLELLVGRGEGIDPQLVLVQGGLFIGARQDVFVGSAYGLHRDLARALAAAGFGVVVDLPLTVPLNKGRSAVAGSAARAVDAALITAFERFVLQDALHDKDLLRAVDHRLSSVLERLVAGALDGETTARPEPAVGELAPPSVRSASVQPTRRPLRSPEGNVGAGGARVEGTARTVAAPEEVIRFAGALLDAPVFSLVRADVLGVVHRELATLREVVRLFRAGELRLRDRALAAGEVGLASGEPLTDALWRKLTATAEVMAATVGADARLRAPAPSLALERTSRDAILSMAAGLPGVPALAAAMTVLERIDGAISLAAGLAPSPIYVHQDLYGPDEMAHTDGNGISVNIASPRVRALLASVLSQDDRIAFSALVDLLLHEKTHVSLASYVPRTTAEHGASFYRRKDLLRRKLLEGIAGRSVGDPMQWLAVARRGLAAARLPSPAALAATLAATRQAA